MDFWGVLLVVVRRWYVALPAFLLVLGGTGVVYISVPKVYTSFTVLMVTAPINGGTVTKNATKTNPMLNFSSGMKTTASLLVQSLNSPHIAAEVGATPSSGTSLKVLNGAGNTELLETGPYLVIAAESDSPAKALSVAGAVAGIAQQHLAGLQQEVKAPKPTYLTLVAVVPPTVPQAARTGRIRAAISALALGVMGSLTLTFMAESAFAARRRRPPRARHSATPPDRKPNELVGAGNSRRPGGRG